MFFTLEDYKKIYEWITRHSIKDTEFVETTDELKELDIFTIVHEGINMRVSFKDLVNLLFLIGVSDFLNITDRYNESNITLEKAISLVPCNSRKIGLVISFINEKSEWKIYLFKGELNLWEIVDLWEDLLDFNKYIINSILPDEEDLTKTLPDENGNSYLSLKDRKYEPDNYSGLGRVILRKNIIEIEDPIYGKVKKNVLYQDMINKENTIYEIRYDFDLNGQKVTIPDNCTLIFEGGSLKNGILNGNNINIISPDTTIFNNIHGTLQLTNGRFYTIWFGNDTKSVNDSTQLVVKDTTLVLPQNIVHNDTIIIEKYNLEWISGKTTLNDKPFLQIINQCKSINLEGSYINNTNEYDGDVIILGGNISTSAARITPIISYYNLGNIKNSNSYRCNGLTIRFTNINEYLYNYNISITGVKLKNVINFEIQQGSNISENKFTITSWHSINAINFVNTQEFNSISHILGHSKNTFNVLYQDSNDHPSIASKVLNIENYDLINAKRFNGNGLYIEYSLWDVGAKNKFIDYIPNAVYKNKNNISILNAHFDFHGNNNYNPIDRSFYTNVSNSFNNIFIDNILKPQLQYAIGNVPISVDTREEAIKSFIAALIKIYNRNIHIRIPFSSTTGNLAVVRDTINKLFYFKDVKSIQNMSGFGILDIDLFGTESNVKENERWIGLKVKFENSDISTYFVVNFTYHYEETEIIFDNFNVEPTVTISTSAHGTINPNYPHLYSSYFNTSVKKQIFWNGKKWIDSNGVAYNVTSSGSYSKKPTEEDGINIGYGYFCTDRKTTEGNTNGIMIYYKGNNVWVDALGRTAS